MKIAVGLISIFLGLIVLVQACAVATTAGLADASHVQGAGALGMLVGLLLFVAGAFAFGLPLVSAILLVVAGLLGLMASRNFSDMGVWAVVAFGLAAMAAFAWRSQRRARAVVADAPSPIGPTAQAPNRDIDPPLTPSRDEAAR